jgi:hypothetical protein
LASERSWSWAFAVRQAFAGRGHVAQSEKAKKSEAGGIRLAALQEWVAWALRGRLRRQKPRGQSLAAASELDGQRREIFSRRLRSVLPRGSEYESNLDCAVAIDSEGPTLINRRTMAFIEAAEEKIDGYRLPALREHRLARAANGELREQHALDHVELEERAGWRAITFQRPHLHICFSGCSPSMRAFQIPLLHPAALVSAGRRKTARTRGGGDVWRRVAVPAGTRRNAALAQASPEPARSRRQARGRIRNREPLARIVVIQVLPDARS